MKLLGWWRSGVGKISMGCCESCGQVKNESDVTIASLQGNRYSCGIMSGQQAALATPCLPTFNKVSGDRFMLRDQPLFQGALSASARNGLVGYVANRPTVVFLPTKVLPSAGE